MADELGGVIVNPSQKDARVHIVCRQLYLTLYALVANVLER